MLELTYMLEGLDRDCAETALCNEESVSSACDERRPSNDGRDDDDCVAATVAVCDFDRWVSRKAGR